MNHNGIYTFLTPLLAFGLVIGFALAIGFLYLNVHDVLYAQKLYDLAKLLPTLIALVLLVVVGGIAALIAVRTK
jgi:hypothetical protein